VISDANWAEILLGLQEKKTVKKWAKIGWPSHGLVRIIRIIIVKPTHAITDPISFL
jgi:hypothetical protein